MEYKYIMATVMIILIANTAQNCDRATEKIILFPFIFAKPRSHLREASNNDI